jgi:mannitol/fructose-specific phosphotransferase system IIA component
MANHNLNKKNITLLIKINNKNNLIKNYFNEFKKINLCENNY